MNLPDIITALSGIYAITYILDSLVEISEDLNTLKKNKKRLTDAYNIIDDIKVYQNKTEQKSIPDKITYPKELDEIITKFKNYIDEENFIICTQKLKSLKINYINILKDIKKYLQNFCDNEGIYSPENNTIDIYKIFSKKEVLSHEFLHMASTNNQTSGFCTRLNETWIGNGLDEGYTELLNQRIFEAKKTSYTYNIEIVKLLELLFDNPKEMEYAYFHSNIFIIYKTFLKYGSKEDFFTILQNLDNLIETDIPIYKKVIATKTKIIIYETIKKMANQNKIKIAKSLLDKDPAIKLIKTKNTIKNKTYKKKRG